jgi:hypothetical protein
VTIAEGEERLLKPSAGSACSSCGYCCTAQPCSLAAEFLKCSAGPCWALEKAGDGKLLCGLVRNPLGYLFKAANPQASVDVTEAAPDSEAAHQLSSTLASALGLGMGCDAVDDDESAAWNAGIWRAAGAKQESN